MCTHKYPCLSSVSTVLDRKSPLSNARTCTHCVMRGAKMRNQSRIHNSMGMLYSDWNPHFYYKRRRRRRKKEVPGSINCVRAYITSNCKYLNVRALVNVLMGFPLYFHLFIVRCILFLDCICHISLVVCHHTVNRVVCSLWLTHSLAVCKCHNAGLNWMWMNGTSQ